MVTVGFREIYRYGGRFVGYLLVVVGLAGAFLGGGAYLASQAMTLTEPTVSALSQTRAFVGVVAMAIGVLLGTIGFFGLAHKLLAESMERALGAHEAPRTVSTGTTADEGEADRETPKDESDADVVDESDSEHETSESTEPEGPEPGTDQPTPSAPLIGDPASSHAGGGTPSEGERAGSEPAPADESTSVAGADTAVPADDSESWAGHGERTEDDAATVEEPADDSPPEWTPPDPAEFESPSDPEPAVDATEPVEDGVDDEAIDPEEVPDDETLADQGVESFRVGGEDDPLADRLPGDEE